MAFYAYLNLSFRSPYSYLAFGRYRAMTEQLISLSWRMEQKGLTRCHD